MDNNHQQILNLINKSQNILLLTHAKADCDGLGSMISMYLALQQLGKNVTAATNDPTPEVLNFLPSIGIVQNSLFSNDFVIQLNIQKTPLKTIKYKLADDRSKVNIIITPKNGQFKPEDVSFGQDEWQFDLIITFDTGNLEHLGPIYEQNAELFFKTPLINIDHHASNTDYGQVNLVDVVAASTTEVLMDLLKNMEDEYKKTFIDEDVATLLLAGLITDTGSFQHANTSPKAMEVAAKLLEKGARQQEIIKNIYKTKKLSTLKLWGTVLSKVQTDPIYRLVWSSITKNDLQETNSTADESEGLIDDLLSNAPGAEMIMLFKYNEDGYVSVSMRSTTNSADVGQICSEMGGGGHIRAAGFKRRDGSGLEKLIEDTLQKAREYQGKRLNIHPEDAQNIVEIPEKNLKPQENKEKIEPSKNEVAPQNPSENQPKKVQYLDFKSPESQKKNENQNRERQASKIKEEGKDKIKTLTRDFTSKPKKINTESKPAPKPQDPERPKMSEKKQAPVAKPSSQNRERQQQNNVDKKRQNPMPSPQESLKNQAQRQENKPKNQAQNAPQLSYPNKVEDVKIQPETEANNTPTQSPQASPKPMNQAEDIHHEEIPPAPLN